MKRLLFLLIMCYGFVGLQSQTIQVNSSCFGTTFNFGIDQSRTPDATGRNFYRQTDVPTTNLVIAFNSGANRWEIRGDNGGSVFYINTFASSPNPPDGATSAWSALEFCSDTPTVSGSGTQTTIGGDPCDGLGGDTDGDGACDDNDICPGFDDFADQDSDGIPDGCDNNPTVPDGVLVDASCLDPDPILFTLSGTDGTGRNVYSTAFANGLEVRYNLGQGRWEVRASSGAMDVYLFNNFDSWPDPPASAGTWQGTTVLNCNSSPTPTINGSGTQNTLGCTISIGTPSVTQPPCGGDGVISVIASGARGSVTYILKKSGVVESSNGTGIFVALDAGTYTVLASDGAFPAGVCEAQTGSISLVVQDNVNPTASNPPTLNLSCIFQVPAADPAVVTDEADNCGTPTVSFFNQTDNGGFGNQADPLIVERTYRVTDASGNFIDVYQTINVVDNTPPTINCPVSIIEPNDIGLCSAVVIYATPTGSDNCGIPSITRISGLASGSSFPVGTTLVTYEATDAAGNTKTCSFTVTVEDEEKPVAVCRNISVNLGAGDVYNLTAIEIDGGSNDNCSVSLSIPPTSFDCADVGKTIPVELTATDGVGATDVCTAMVTVGETEAPVLLTCPAAIEANNDPGLCGATVNFSLPTFSDNCAVTGLLGNGWDPGDLFPIGTTTVNYTGFDASGNQSELCSFTVTVKDVELPMLECIPTYEVDLKADGTLDLLEGITQQATWIIETFFTTFEDNCDVNDQLVNKDNTLIFDCDDLGDNLATFFAFDIYGNESNCTVNIIVSDPESACNQPPTAACQQGFIIAVDGSCTASITPEQINNGSSDPDGDPLILSLDNEGPFSPGTYTVELTVSDGSLDDKCTATIAVIDNQDPILICSNNIVQTADPSTCGAIVNFNPPSAVDNCPGAVISRLSGINTGSLFPVGVTTQKYQVVDASGNIDECEFTITVTDDQDPVLICSGNIVRTTDLSVCGAIVNFDPPSAVDNCPGAVITRLSGINTGSLFPVGVTLQRYRVVDDSGNTDECEFTVTVTDDQDPELICSGNIVKTNDAGLCGAIVTFDPPSAVDNCPGAVITRLSGINTGSLFPLGVTLQRYQVVDDSGNTDECEFTITVSDDEAAVARCKSATIVLDDAGIAVLTPVDIDDGSTDNCDVPWLSTDFSVFDCYELGDHIVTLTAEDSKGQSSTCTAVVTVEGEDADCDNVADLCDLCPGGDDRVDNNNDGSPDCIDFPGVNKLIEEWRCGNKGRKVTICHIPDGDYSKRNTLCISAKDLREHLEHGDFIGPCDNATCDEDRQLAFQSTYRQTAPQALRLYPNPVSDRLRVELSIDPTEDGDQLLVIFNTVGQQVYTERVNGDLNAGHELDVSQLRAGIYYVQVRVDGRMLATSKLVVSR